MFKKKNFIILAIIIIFPLFIIGSSAQAGLLTNDNVKTMAEMTKTSAGFNDMSLGDLVAQILKTVLSLLGIIFLVIMVFAGYRWMTASGNEEAITNAKGTIKRAIIGLIIIISAYAITAFIFNQLPFTGNISGGGGPTILD